MRELVGITVIVALVMGAFSVAPAQAGKKKKKKARIERTVEIPYSCPCGINPVLGFKLDTIVGENIGGATIPITYDDVYMTGVAEDALGQNVYVSFSQDTDGDGLNDDVGAFCGETEKPLKVSHVEFEYRMFIYSGLCDDNTPALASQGTITLTFSNLP
ncbi:MAG: hypothetical protein ACRDKT_09335 [Actinomycetota bacterium]